MGFGKIFNNAWGEFSSNFLSILIFVLIFYLAPLVVFSIAFGAIAVIFGFSNSFDISNEVINPLELGSLIGPFILFASLFVLLMIGLLVFVYSGFYGISVKTKKYSWKDIASIAKKNYWKLLGRGILLCIIITLLYILLIIPGIIFSIYWIFAVFIWFNEPEKGFGYSLRKSRELVKGRWWKTFGYVLFIILIYIVFNLIVSIIPIVGGLINTFAGFFAIYFFRHMYIEYSSVSLKNSKKKK